MLNQRNPVKEAILFIDGNNFYHNIRQMNIRPGDVDFYKLSELICSHFGLVHKHSVYYNSIPNIADGKEVYFKHMRFLSEIEKLPKFELKTRKLQKHSTRELLEEKRRRLSDLDLCDKCRPLVESNCTDCVGTSKKREKGIDVMIALDMVENAIDNKYDYFVLVSGDADFLPAFDLIKKKGKEVFSAFLTKGYSFQLREKYPFFIIGGNLIMERCMK